MRQLKIGLISTFCVVHNHTEITVLNELFRRFEVALVYKGRTAPQDIIPESILSITLQVEGSNPNGL